MISPTDDEPSGSHARMLYARDESQRQLHANAVAATSRFGRKVFLRAVIEVSNYCRENCTYCGMRRDNRALHRFRANHDELANLLIHHRPSSITDVNIQTGEDPLAIENLVLPLVRTLHRETNLGISVCLGTLRPEIYSELQSAGASIYIMKFEIADARLYETMEAPGTLGERLEHIRHLAATGWDVSSGFIAGLPGQDTDSLLANFALARQLPLAGCSVSPFIPGESTPLAHVPMADIDTVLNCMAMLRLMRPDWVIPAVSALNLAGPETGYRRGLATGANLVTMNLTPPRMRDDYVLYKRDRFIMTEERILSAIAAEGLTPSKQSLANYYQSQRASVRHPSTDSLTAVR